MDCVRWSSIVTAGELKSLEWTYVTAAEGDRLIVSHHRPEFAKPARDTRAIATFSCRSKSGPRRAVGTSPGTVKVVAEVGKEKQ